MIIACAAIGAIAALAVSLTARDHRPGANAEVRVAQPITSTLNTGSTFSSSIAADVAAQLEKGDGARAFEARVGRAAGGLDPDQVARDVTLTNPVDTADVLIVARGDDDSEATRLATAVTREVAAAIDRASAIQTAPMLRAAESSRGADGASASSSDVLGVIARVRADSAALSNVARVTAKPEVTGAGGKRRIALNVVAGLILGALVGAAVAFLAGRGEGRKT